MLLAQLVGLLCTFPSTMFNMDDDDLYHVVDPNVLLNPFLPLDSSLVQVSLTGDITDPASHSITELDAAAQELLQYQELRRAAAKEARENCMQELRDTIDKQVEEEITGPSNQPPKSVPRNDDRSASTYRQTKSQSKAKVKASKAVSVPCSGELTNTLVLEMLKSLMQPDRLTTMASGTCKLTDKATPDVLDELDLPSDSSMEAQDKRAKTSRRSKKKHKSKSKHRRHRHISNSSHSRSRSPSPARSHHECHSASASQASALSSSTPGQS